MNLKGLISISGTPGIFKIVANTRNGFIVESLADKKRTAVTSVQKVTALEDISVYTGTEDLPLVKVFAKMKENLSTHPPVDAKSDPAALRAYFIAVVPEHDTERVYPSDIKKIITWFEQVKELITDENETPDENAGKDSDGAAPLVLKTDESVHKASIEPKARPITQKKVAAARTRKKV